MAGYMSVVGKPHTARERQRILADRKRRLQQSREELERIRESNIDMGLRLEPIRPATRTPHLHSTPSQRMSTTATTTNNNGKHPPTPNSSESSRDFPMHRGVDYFMNNGDQLSMEEMMCRGFSQWLSDNFSTASNSQPGSRPGGEIVVEGAGVGAGGKPAEKAECSPQDVSGTSSTSGGVQLPDIVAERVRKRGRRKDRTLPDTGTSTLQAGAHSNKKVHFAEGLPFIRGSSLQVPPQNTTKQETDSASRPMPTSKAAAAAEGGGGGEGEAGDDGLEEDAEMLEAMLKPPWTAPVMERSLTSMTPRAKNCRPLSMPRIDIVSEIYDELIVKTIQSFLAREGYSEAKFSNLRKKIMARLSATYPHLTAHKAWRAGHKESGHQAEGPGPLPPTETDERTRLRIRPLHQGFFASDHRLDVSGGGEFARESSWLGRLPQPPYSSRQTSDFLRPRWVPVLPMYRSTSCINLNEDEACSGRGPTFMAIDGRHMTFTPREDLPLKTATLPGATSSFRMGPLTLSDDPRPPQTWTHIIPNAIDE
ncbi:uncharacterized protein LOC143296055 [Babylonia areolata]|uniref:uncharacterized protein LOC143296055 n=1 Tax=Babylonia areolata TaxID=304850 RepID=UPI003FD55468